MGQKVLVRHPEKNRDLDVPRYSSIRSKSDKKWTEETAKKNGIYDTASTRQSGFNQA